jgi:hypothetical protein
MPEPFGGGAVVELGLASRGVGMASDDRYRQFAEKCVRVAQQTSNPNDKALLLEMAEVWRRLAEKASSSPTDAEPS